jgi:chromosome segregation protein
VFLRRVTLTGFKSFANKTVLDLEPGITAIVGPNGSGKSNLADAVRWAFGEQSRGRLRLGDREDIVFVGTDKRARASYAEAVILFDNEDGTFPLDLTEVEISRRVYRSGESEYRLAGRSIRLSDLQALLAQAGFGANTYAVIGQGMIDSFLLSSPAERKLLFDEAAGIRGPELGRESARRKLTATATNLTRLRDIEAEIAPRLELLEHSVKAAELRRQLEAEVEDMSETLAAARLIHWSKVHSELTQRRATLTQTSRSNRRELQSLQNRLIAIEREASKTVSEREQLQSRISRLEHERDQLALELGELKGAVATAEQAHRDLKSLTSRHQQAVTDLESAHEHLQELQAEQSANSEASVRALQVVKEAATAVSAAQTALVAIRRRSATDGTRDQYVSHALEVLKLLANHLSSSKFELAEAKILAHKAGRLLSLANRTSAADLLADLKSAQKALESAMVKRETAVEHQTNITITGRSLEIDLAHQAEAVKRAGVAIESLKSLLAPLSHVAESLPALQSSNKTVDRDLQTATHRLDQFRDQLRRLSAPSDGAESQAGLAAAIERARAAAEATELESAALADELRAATTELAAARRQAPTSTRLKALPDQPLPELEAELLRAEARLEAQTGAHREQVHEYEALNARHTELVAQIADLSAAQSDLERVIAELDALIRDRFRTNFKALADQFATYFSRLFPGGSAGLELTESDDGTYGIQIKASPGGKRLSGVASLSGGERALAGVALLAAILRVNPSPFVVLDEIDAALDEANSGRLATILEELQEHSQLIVITHNRQTMRAARVLFGVTLNEHHVSHLLSMRLEDATALAAR